MARQYKSILFRLGAIAEFRRTARQLFQHRPPRDFRAAFPGLGRGVKPVRRT